jgi:hypothetical protein
MVNVPNIQFVLQNPAIDPSGSRHLLSGAAGFLKLLGTGAGEELNFGSINTTGSGAISDTKLIYARASSLGDASGIFNMRFYLKNTSAWGAGTYRFLEQKHLHFQPNLILNSAAQNTPTVVPLTTNISGTIQQPQWTFGSPWISGVIDNDASMYVYLAIEVAANVPVGTLGGAGAGSFRYSLIYDFS